MKNFPPSIRFIFIIISLIICFATYSDAQQTQGKIDDKKVIYISSKPKKESTRPRIATKKATPIVKVSPDNLVEIKPDDLSLEKDTFQLINDKRVEYGLKPLVWNEKLAKLGRQHSQNMARHNFFSHVGLNGRLIDQRAIDFGINKWRAIGENIAFNQGFEKPADFAVKRWMLSDGHRRNLLDGRWKESGIGICVTTDGKYFFTQVFLLK